MFSKEELMMIQQVFSQANFPGQACGAIGRFLEKVNGLIQEYNDQPPHTMRVDPEKGKPQA